MKKSVAFITILLVIVFAGSFAISVANQKIQQKKLVKKLLHPSRTNSTEIASNNNYPQTKEVFYSSVGGSTQKAKGLANAKKITARYTIDLAKLKSQTEAENFLLKLKSKGFDGFYTPTRRGSEVIYNVRLGMFTNSEEAKISISKIATSTQISGTITKLQ